MAQRIVFSLQRPDGNTVTAIHTPASNVYVPSADQHPSENLANFEVQPTILDENGASIFDPAWRAASLEEIGAHAVKQHNSAVGYAVTSDYHIVDDSQWLSSQDPYFREAWVHTNGVISTDMPTAASMQKDYLREIRQPLLQKLDVCSIRAAALGNATIMQSIENKKQILRDITVHPDISNATTPAQLKIAGIDTINGVEIPTLSSITT